MMKTCSPGTSRFDENDSFAMGEYVSKNFNKNTSQIICQQNEWEDLESDFGSAMEK